MQSEKTALTIDQQTSELAPVVIVGAGPVGIRAAQEINKRAPDQPVIIYGAEAWRPYNRVKLSSVLAGELSVEDIHSNMQLDESHTVQLHCKVLEIDTSQQLVIDDRGHRQHYHSLILATGSTPHIPLIDGVNLAGVYTFRNLDDTQQLLARRMRSHRTVVIGGGLLGIEAARAMQRFNTDIHLIEFNAHLMYRQLDNASGEMLRDIIEDLNITVHCQSSVKKILGDDRVEGVLLSTGEQLDCDTVVVATGIVPNTELAKQAGLAIGRGIKVDDYMRTSQDTIYAVGECAEYKQTVYGLVAPGFEQASVAAYAITTGESRRYRYRGSSTATHLKVINESVFSMGAVGEEEHPLTYREFVYSDIDNGVYRKVVLKNNRLYGTIALGAYSELNRLQEAIQHHRMVWPWQINRFKQTGELWNAEDIESVVDWPASATVCQCTGINRGVLSTAVNDGCVDVQCLMNKTGASTVCGGCKPLLTELLGSESTVEPVEGRFSLAIAGLFTTVLTLLYLFLPAIQPSETVQGGWQIQSLWTDGLIKQITGYTAASMMLIALLLSLRKRLKKFTVGKYSIYRILHAVLGVAAVVTLFMHSGLSMGENLNQLLMISVVGLMLLGAATAFINTEEHRMQRAMAKRLRRYVTWSHILLFWPLPALLGFHILSVYYF